MPETKFSHYFKLNTKLLADSDLDWNENNYSDIDMRMFQLCPVTSHVLPRKMRPWVNNSENELVSVYIVLDVQCIFLHMPGFRFHIYTYILVSEFLGLFFDSEGGDSMFI
jgi:hypothetical protein